MRAFIAIDLPDKIKGYLSKIQKELKINSAKIKWVEKENLHLTVKFLGELDEAKINEVKQALSKIEFKPQTVSLSEIGVFPSENYIRVIWAGIKPSDKIVELQQKIETSLAELGIKKENRKFETHITLGRVKFIKDKKELIDKIKSVDIKTEEFVLDCFKLKKSTLTEKGPVYEDLSIFPVK